MAMIVPPGGLWYVPPLTAGTASSFVGTTINAAGEKVAACFRVPKSGVLNRCEFVVGTVGNNPDNGLRVSFQDLDASGHPDGTQDQFRTMAGPFVGNTWQTPGLMTSDGTDTGIKRTVVAGDRIALVVEFESFVASDSIDIRRYPLLGADGTGEMEYYSDEFITGAWVRPTSTPGMIPLALEYVTDGYVNILENCYPILAFANATYNTGSTPDERALRFQVPMACVCDGAWIRADFDGDCDILLIDSDGTTVLATTTVDSSARGFTTGATAVVRWAGVALTANTTYRVSVRPSTVTSLNLFGFTVENNARMLAAPGGTTWYQSTRTDAGAWTDTDTSRPFIGLHLSQIDDGAAAASTIQIATTQPIILHTPRVVSY